MAGGLVAHTHMCLAGFGKLLKEWGLVILGGDILNSINAPRNRHPSFAECFGQSGGSLCHERLMHWVRYPGPWRFPGVVHWLDWETSADLPCSTSSPSTSPVGSTALGERESCCWQSLALGCSMEDVPSAASCPPVKAQPAGGSSLGQGVQSLAGAFRRVG